MLIRKLFKTEGPAHIVRNCSTDRCSKSIHGHSYVWEVLLEGDKLDNGGMIVDFGLLKDEVKHFIDLMDHCHMQWEKDIDTPYFEEYSARYIGVPFSPSAEFLCVFAYKVVEKILEKTKFANGETEVKLHSVICHETQTGYAQCFKEDVDNIEIDLSKVFVKHDLRFFENLLKEDTQFTKIIPEHQVCIN